MKFTSREIFKKKIFVTGKEMKPMLPKKKSRLDIYVDILWSIKNGFQEKESIVDATGITGSIIKEMLDSLKSMGFILEVVKPNWDSKNMITLFDFTEKGKRVMEYLKYLDEVTDGLDRGDLLRKDDVHRDNNSNL